MDDLDIVPDVAAMAFCQHSSNDAAQASDLQEDPAQIRSWPTGPSNQVQGKVSPIMPDTSGTSHFVPDPTVNHQQPVNSSPNERTGLQGSHSEMEALVSRGQPSVPTSVPSAIIPGSQSLTGQRIFLDICCGVNSPLSTAVRSFHGDVMRFDILVHTTDNLLDAECFEQLLRLCASGLVAYSAASPSCREYSRVKLLPNGPPALHTPQHLDGVPGLSRRDLLRVQESAIMLERCVQCLQVTISSGGHGHLEQPKSAMSWEEPEVQQFIVQHSCSCISMAACGFDRDWHKHWVFASTWVALTKLACSCNHPLGSHQQIAGVRTATGQYLSRETAEYPPSLAYQFAQIISPLLSTNSLELDLTNFHQYLPIKGISAPPFSRQDGAGFPSQADWSGSHSFEDCFQILRRNFFRTIMDKRMDQQILQAFHARQSDPPFPEEQLQPFRAFVDEFLLAQGIQPDWSIPADQLLCLHILQKLCQCMQDSDVALFQYLIPGVPLGIHEDIEPSKCFPIHQEESPIDPPHCFQSITSIFNQRKMNLRLFRN